ncbi:uncharacterized protein LOC126055157 [Helicoverpa armigera]|uniref:uncharacterized protein LOC126055157 n=1 Tax=Helicoverpa armigera TaxID=29058 RepID=UPI00308279B2
MPKRKVEDKIERYKEKIRKLEGKRRRIRAVSSSDSEQNTSPRELENPNDEVIDCEPDAPMDPPSDAAPASEAPTDLPLAEAEPAPLAVLDLDPNILAALGEITDETPEFGAKIHENLAKLWLPLLKKGMTKECREALMANYPIPENCSLLQAPALNLEVSAAIPESSRFRDKKMTATQQQLGVGITAINRGLHLLVNSDSRIEAIKYISDGCRILSDLHHQNTEARVKFITPCLDKSFLQFLDRSERDSTLFGNDLSEKIKASKAIVKQGDLIKKPSPASKPSASKIQPTVPRSSYQGNWSGPSRSQSNRGGGRGGQNRINYRTPPTTSAAATTSRARYSHKPRASTRRR